MLHTTIPSPVGDLLLLGDEAALHSVVFPDYRVPPGARRSDAAFARAREQFERYFAGELTEFDLPLAPVGTPFQHQVWAALRAIPYGETRSYGELAAQIGRPGAARAVGLANGRNPLPIVVPCHRVIGANGSLTGFGGGIERKAALLALESRYLASSATASSSRSASLVLL